MQVVDISGWALDQGFSPYPEGSREKYAIFAPEECAVNGITGGHRYLVKFSNRRYPTQFWCEVMAFLIADALAVAAPPTFVAMDPITGEPASLAAWFYGERVEQAPLPAVGIAAIARKVAQAFLHTEDIPKSHSLYVPGSNYMARLIKDYDLKKGTQHNFVDFAVWVNFFRRMFKTDAWAYWARVFVFDTLIGNTDRHQDNWGVLWRRDVEGSMIPRYAPAFDNGTSLLHEITDQNLCRFADEQFVDRYIDRGTHHLRWDIDAPKRLRHFELIERMVAYKASTAATVEDALQVDLSPAFEAIRRLTRLNVPVPLTNERAEAVISVVARRAHRLREIYL